MSKKLQPPADLTAEQQKEFSRVAGELAQADIVEQIGIDAIASYAVSFCRWRDAEKQVAASGSVIKAPNGYPAANPFLGVSNTAARQMRQFQDRVADARRRAQKTRARTAPARPRMRIVADDLNEAANG